MARLLQQPQLQAASGLLMPLQPAGSIQSRNGGDHVQCVLPYFTLEQKGCEDNNYGMHMETLFH